MSDELPNNVALPDGVRFDGVRKFRGRELFQFTVPKAHPSKLATFTLRRSEVATVILKVRVAQALADCNTPTVPPTHTRQPRRFRHSPEQRA